MGGYINMDRGDFYNSGIQPRQRRVFVLRWNPSISDYTRKDFEKDFKQLKGIAEGGSPLKENVWTVWDWEKVMHRDLFVMMQVGQEINGIVWGGFLCGAPFQFQDNEGNLTKSHFMEMTTMYMHRIEKTGILTADRLSAAVPDVDWLHGHSGEMISVEDAEKLGLFLVDELKNVEESRNVFFDSYCEKRYVLNDIMTFMCPELKRRLQAMGRSEEKQIMDINNLMVSIQDEDYSHWDILEEHLKVEELNGILM